MSEGPPALRRAFFHLKVRDQCKHSVGFWILSGYRITSACQRCGMQLLQATRCLLPPSWQEYLRDPDQIDRRGRKNAGYDVECLVGEDIHRDQPEDSDDYEIPDGSRDANHPHIALSLLEIRSTQINLRHGPRIAFRTNTAIDIQPSDRISFLSAPPSTSDVLPRHRGHCAHYRRRHS